MKPPGMRVYRTVFLPVLAALCVVPAADAGANSITRDNLTFPLDARGAGMGQTGNSDPCNVANVAFNPAIVSLLEGFHIVYGHSDVTFLLAELKLDGVIAGVGRRWPLDESLTLGGGLAFGYAKERWGYLDFDDRTPDWGAYDRGYHFTAGVSGMYNEIIHAGIGLCMKQWKWDNAADNDFIRQILEATVWDAGIEAAAVLSSENRYTLAVAAGFAYSNFGGSVDVVDNPDYFAEEGGGNAPEFRRYGVHVRCDGPSWSRADDVFETSLPVVSAAVNYDIVDRVTRFTGETARHAVGGELGIFDILFFRLGRISEKEVYASSSGLKQRTVVDTTLGFGIAVPFRGYFLRFDHAQRHFDTADVYQHLYSLLLEVSFQVP